MRPLLRSKVGQPTFVAAKMRLPLAAAITTVLLVISFSTRARSEGAAQGTHPRWKILVLIYDKTDAIVTDTQGVNHHMVGAMTRSEVERATLASTEFVETDIPALTSGNMIPELTIRYPEHALTQLDPFGEGWWPSPANTAPDRDPAFDSVIVIWDPRVVDQSTGTDHWIGGGAGLAVPMDVGQTYATVIIEATGYPDRNVFKHEWGHSILFYFEAVGRTPQPTVTNHAVINQYVHWPTGESYVWVDETIANPIPNSIYNNESGFTHDYYSGTTATADQPTRRLGITPEAWMLGGPVTKPDMGSPSPPINDGEAPVFVHIPPPVIVTTGPGATSCGAIVEDTSLGSTAPGSDPVILDPTGDLNNPPSSPGHDIVSTDARFDAESLTFTVSFAGQVFPASFRDPRSLLGFIDIDTDQNPTTGGAPLFDPGNPRMNLGVEFRIDLVNESTHPGFVDIRTEVGIVGTVPILFTDTSFRVTVPLALLGGDNGLVNYSVHMGVFGFGQTDRVPNGSAPIMSVPVPELIAIDGRAGVTINRNGVPPNNFFPVGETLITYTATDASGNAASVTQIVTVIDDTPPVISGAAVSASTLWPPNHDMVDVTVNYEATDNCALFETRLIVSSNEPAGGRAGSDWEIVDAHHVRLRAERSGRSGDRLYTITITAKDVHGNVSTQNVTVRVPHSNRKGVPKAR